MRSRSPARARSAFGSTPGRTQVELETRQLEQVNECFEDVLAGRVPARLVFDLR